MTRSSIAPDLMRRYYPSCRHVLLLSLLLFPAIQFAVFAMVGGYSERIGLLTGELTIVWVVFLSIRINKWIAEDLLLVNATRLSVLFGAAVAGVGGSLVIADLDLLFERLISSYGLAPPLALQRASLELQVVAGLSEVPLALAAIVVAPAVCEEAFFRGFLLTTLVVRRTGDLGPHIRRGARQPVAVSRLAPVRSLPRSPDLVDAQHIPGHPRPWHQQPPLPRGH